MEPQRIDIEQFDLTNEKVTEPICMYIELGGNYLLYTAEYYGEVPVAEDSNDHSMGWEEKYVNFSIKIKREQLCSLDISWVHKKEVWNVEVEANGYPNTVSFYFKKEKEARRVYSILNQYIFKNDA